MTDIDAMWQELETRDERVDIYRAYQDAAGRRHWVVRLHGIGYHGDTIAEAIGAAHAAPLPLPRVPRQPVVLFDQQPMRVGQLWNVVTAGSSWGRFKTKRDAVAAIETMRAQHAEWYDEWMRAWAPVVHGGTHGVDWLWEDDPR